MNRKTTIELTQTELETLLRWAMGSLWFVLGDDKLEEKLKKEHAKLLKPKRKKK